MDPAGELAQLLDGHLQLRCGLVGRGDRVGIANPPGREPASEPPERQRDRDEPLLRAIVQVALEPPSLLVGGLHDPRPRAADLRLDGADIREVADDRRHLVRVRSGRRGPRARDARPRGRGRSRTTAGRRCRGRPPPRASHGLPACREHRLVETAPDRDGGVEVRARPARSRPRGYSPCGSKRTIRSGIASTTARSRRSLWR